MAERSHSPRNSTPIPFDAGKSHAGHAVKLPLTDKYLERFGHQYILLMMIITRLGGSIGGLLVVYYVELTLVLSDEIRRHFEISCLIVVVLCITVTVLMPLWELRHVRRVLRSIKEGRPIDPEDARHAGREAVVFAAHHHRFEAWYVPLSCLGPVAIYLHFWHAASAAVLLNLTWTVFMGVSMALMSTFFSVEYCMKAVIRHLLAHGVAIEYQTIPKGSLRFRLGLSSL